MTIEGVGATIQAWAAVRFLPFNLNSTVNRLGFAIRNMGSR